MLGLYWSLGVKIAVFGSKTAFLGQKQHFWALIIQVLKPFSPSRPLFWTKTSPIGPIWCWHMCWAPIHTFWGVLGPKICNLWPFYWAQFAKVGLKWAKMTKIIILCIKVILFGSNWPKPNRKQSDSIKSFVKYLKFLETHPQNFCKWRF